MCMPPLARRQRAAAADGDHMDLVQGDFAVVPVGQITFKVDKRVRMFFTDHQSSS